MGVGSKVIISLAVVAVAIFLIGAWSLGPLGRALTGNDPFTMFEAGVGTVSKTGQTVGNQIGSKLDTVTQPGKDSTEVKTKVTSVQDKVPVSTTTHLLSDTYVITPGTEKIIRFTTDTGSMAHLIGTALVNGGGRVWLQIKNQDGNCPNIMGCEMQLVSDPTAASLMGTNSNSVKNNVSLRVFTGSENQLVLRAEGTQKQTITLDLSVSYENTEVKPAFDAVTNVANLDSQTITSSIQKSINEKRATFNIVALKWSPILSQVAQDQSQFMSQSKTITLYDAVGKSPTARALAKGYDCNTRHSDGLNYLINEVSTKVDTRDGLATNEKISNYAASYLFDNGAKDKFNYEAGISTTIDNTGIVWITFDGC